MAASAVKLGTEWLGLAEARTFLQKVRAKVGIRWFMPDTKEIPSLPKAISRDIWKELLPAKELLVHGLGIHVGKPAANSGAVTGKQITREMEPGLHKSVKFGSKLCYRSRDLAKTLVQN